MRTPKKPIPKNLGGRPPKVIDVRLVEGLARIQCTDEEIAATCGVSVDTLARRKKDDPAFVEALDRGRALGRASLRRVQWAEAQKGNTAMAIFLGKNLLGQRDRWDIDNRQMDADGNVIAPGATFVLKVER